MDEELVKKIEEHLAGFPIRKEEVEQVKREWTDFKSRALTVLIGSIIAFAGYGVWAGTIQASVASNLQRLEVQTTRISAIDSRQQASDITAAEIKTKLTSIEATLIEIKQSLKIR